MNKPVFKLYTTSSRIVLEKGNTIISIHRSSDNDILFSTESDKASIEFDFQANACAE